MFVCVWRRCTNINTFLNHFVGHLNFGTAGIVIDVPRFDTAPPIDANPGLGINDAGFNPAEYLRIPNDDMNVFYWALHPREVTLCITIYQEELDRSDHSQVLLCKFMGLWTRLSTLCANCTGAGAP